MQYGSWYPGLHSSSHVPMIWWQVVAYEQCPQLLLQLSPKYPALHALTANIKNGIIILSFILRTNTLSYSRKKNLLFTSCNLSFFFKSFNFILKTQNIKKNQNLSLVHCKKVWTKIHKITFLAINSSPSWFTSVIAYAIHFVAAFTSCFARFNTIWTKVTTIAFWKRYTHVM